MSSTAHTIMSACGTHRARLCYDSDPSNPRYEYDNACTMVCFHRRYTLGDKDQPKTVDALFRSLLGSDFIDKIEADYDAAYEALYNKHKAASPDPRWNAGTYGHLEPFKSEAAALKASLREKRDVAISRACPVFLKLSLLDHSGLHMWIGGGPHWSDTAGWDSGTIGFIYCTRETILKEWGKGGKRLTKKMIDLATQCAKSEVETYDQFLTGDVYGIIIERLTPDEDPSDNDSWEEVDSCWGFFGFDYAKTEATSMLTSSLAHSAQEAADESLRLLFAEGASD